MIFKVARCELHSWEEPVISGTKGSGTVFFCGCSMRCVFCQNYNISRSANSGLSITEDELLQLFFSLEQEGAHNINLVTPSHYAKPLKRVLEKFKKASTLPIVYNTNAYESVENLKLLDGLVDIYLLT
ncbi:MAG: radical SAM protein [Clostridia bacterium]|nr:radical SAM protein [Clostridia bacterium]